MKRRILIGLLSLGLSLGPSRARADMFGGDVAVLVQILSNAIQQLAQLKAILNNGADTLGLLQDINRGINDSLALLKTINPNMDPGIYREWDKAQTAIQKLQTIYGIVVSSPEQRVQQDTDQQVAEAIALNNSIYSYVKDVDEIGEAIKQYSHQVSPGGAQKLTAQTLGVMLHVLNTSLRAQATGLKLQAQNLALQNRKEKEMTRHVLANSDALQTAMTNAKPTFSLPRF